MARSPCFSSAVHHGLLPPNLGSFVLNPDVPARAQTLNRPGSVDGPVDALATSSSAPSIRQYANISTSGDGQTTQTATFSSSVLTGSTIVVFVTEYNINGSPQGSSPPSPITVTDSQSNSYGSALEIVNAYPPGAGNDDWQGIMLFACANVTGGSSFAVTATYVGLEWQGVFAVEITGAATAVSSLVDHNSNFVTAIAPNTTNGITGPTVTAGSNPAIVLAFSVNSTDIVGDATPGTGWSLAQETWNWGGVEGSANWPSAMLETKTTSAAGSVTPTFSSPNPTPRGLGSNNDDFSQLVVIVRAP